MIAAVPAGALDVARSLAPAGVEVRSLPGPGEDVAAALAGVEFLVEPSTGARDVLEALPQLEALRVVQVLSAGTDWIEPLIPDGVTLCNARGSRDVPVAEWICGALLGVAGGLFGAAREQARGRWAPFRHGELADTRALVVGMGSIGEALRPRLEALGVEVVGVARHARPGVEPLERLHDLLPQFDHVILLTPLTDETRGLADARFLAAMRDGALLVNAARGPVVDTEALLVELRSERLRAALDVTDPEPLPDGHPLWSAPGVFISPHVAGDSPEAERRAERLAAEQLARHARGEPLVNVVRTQTA